jgi:hypothetical protein
MSTAYLWRSQLSRNVLFDRTLRLAFRSIYEAMRFGGLRKAEIAG